MNGDAALPKIPAGKDLMTDAFKKKSESVGTDVLYELTEHGVAKVVQTQNGQDWIYLANQNEWYLWNGKHWELDTTMQINELVKKIAIEKLTEAAGKGNKEKIEFYVKCCDMVKTNHIVASCKSLFAIPPEKIDALSHLLPFENGVYDLNTHTFTPEHKRDQYLTMICPVVFDRLATCPKWEAHMKTVFQGKEDLICFFQELTGYTLLHNNPGEIFIILWGSGKNGKTVTTKVIKAILGKYAKTAQVDTIMKRKIAADGACHRSDLLHIIRSRMVMISEGNAEDELAAGLIKQITGGDDVTIRGAYQKRGEEYSPGFKIWFVTNHLPNIDGADYALMRRVYLIPFTARIEESTKIQEYDRILFEKEGSGILNWMLTGLKRYQERGNKFILPKIVLAEIEKYKTNHDIISQWEQDECVIDPAAIELRSVIVGNYKNWCDTNQYQELKPKQFWAVLVSRGIMTDGVYKEKKRACKGIRLKTGDELKAFYELYEPVKNTKK